MFVSDTSMKKGMVKGAPRCMTHLGQEMERGVGIWQHTKQVLVRQLEAGPKSATWKANAMTSNDQIGMAVITPKPHKLLGNGANHYPSVRFRGLLVPGSGLADWLALWLGPLPSACPMGPRITVAISYHTTEETGPISS